MSPLCRDMALFQACFKKFNAVYNLFLSRLLYMTMFRLHLTDEIGAS